MLSITQNEKDAADGTPLLTKLRAREPNNRGKNHKTKEAPTKARHTEAAQSKT